MRSRDSDDPVQDWSVRMPVLRIDRQSQVTDTIAWIERREKFLRVFREGAVHSFTSPFANYPLHQLVPDGSGLIIVDRDDPVTFEEATFRVLFLDATGDTVYQRSVPFEPVPVSETSMQSALRQTPSNRRGGSPTDTRVLTASEMKRALEDADLIPETLTPVTGLSVGQDGSIWLRRESISPDSVVWQILDQEARHQGFLSLPVRQNVAAAAGELLAVVELNELDVPYVIRYRVQR